jgi:aryl-alcohol dehydrogenase-like predicted oxidoreductase
MSSSRRSFLASGLALPVVASATRSEQAPQTPAKPQSPAKALSSGPDLRYKVLGKTGLKVTTVGFGCMVTSDGSVVERAADLGITYFDTARNYQSGNNERMVGVALKKKRKDLVLSTKTEGHTKEEALAQLDTSLQTLGTDFVDIWYLHAKTKPEDVTDGLIEAQQIAKKAGKIRFAGVSTHSGQKELIPFLTTNPNVDVILTQYNFSMEPFMNDVIDAAAKAGKGVVAMKIMAGGFRRPQPGNLVQEKLKRDGAMLAALKWVVKNPNVHTTVPSMTDMDQLDENMRAFGQPFAAADEKILALQLDHIRPMYCRMCGECEGQCRQGLPVADVLRFLTYADGYGQFALGRERFLQLDAAHTAVRCNECPGCTVQCPYGVHVAQRLIRAQDLFVC